MLSYCILPQLQYYRVIYRTPLLCLVLVLCPVILGEGTTGERISHVSLTTSPPIAT
jgi:hypothetical protein